jgi:hypothetical protein
MTALRIQIDLDCADPHRLADFWADATGYEIEDIDEFVRGIVAAGHATGEETVDIGGKLRWNDFATLRHPDDPVDERGFGTGRRILLHRVPEPKAGKNRMHLDLFVEPGQLRPTVERLVGLGGSVIRESDEPFSSYTVMGDPEGNEFCVCGT